MEFGLTKDPLFVIVKLTQKMRASQKIVFSHFRKKGKMAWKRALFEFVLVGAASVGLCFGIDYLREAGPGAVEAAASAAADSGNGIVYLNVEAPEAKSSDGVVSAEEWSEVYPEITASMSANSENNYRISYIEEDPYITNLYEGYGFAIDYTSAIGHTYTLEDVHNTERPHPLANCLTCKSPNFTKMVNDLGEEVYMYDFEETWQKLDENISCYNCHDNRAGNGGELVVTHSYITKALGDSISSFNPKALACGQCHIEYHFNPETKATTPAFTDLESMHPTKMLEFYDSMDFADWVQESTGARLLKAQHPEFETFLQGVHGKSLGCSDCHMPLLTSEDGKTYHSHKWVSPLESPELLDSCAKCHGDTDMTEKVHAIQAEVTAREKEVGELLSTLNDSLTKAVEDGVMTEEELNEVRGLYRSAQWYWDFCYVENSEGAHNSKLAKECLDTAETLANQAMEKLQA